MGLWSKKNISQLMQESEGGGGPTLNRTLSASNLTLLGIGAIIGAGIFVLTGQAAAQYAGPGIVISFVIAGLGCLFAGLCYAEFASMIPIAGSAYTYGYATLGEFVAWIIGWDLILEYLFAASTVAVGWSGYSTAFISGLGITLPAQFVGAPLAVEGTHTLVRSQICIDPASGGIAVDAVSHTPVRIQDCVAGGFQIGNGILNVPAMLLIVLLTILLVIGIKESARFNNIAVVVKVAIVLLVIAFGFQHVNTANWSPFIPPNLGEFGQFGWSGVFRASGVIFFAYIGFDAVSTAAQEAKNPQRDLPIGILGSLAICTLLYILMSLVMTGMAKYTELGVPHPVFVAIQAAGPALSWLGYLVNIGAIAGLASVVLVMLMGQPRIFYSMARAGLLAVVVAGCFTIGLLGDRVSIGTLLAFVIVSAGIWVLRVRSPELVRPFRTPMVPFVPVMAIIICGLMMYWLPSDTWLRLIIWMAIGLLIYFLYGRHHSKLSRGK